MRLPVLIRRLRPIPLVIIFNGLPIRNYNMKYSQKHRLTEYNQMPEGLFLGLKIIYED